MNINNVDDHTTLDVSKTNFPLCILFQGILHVIIKKMKYDESYNFEHEVFICHLVGVRSILAVVIYLRLNISHVLITSLRFYCPQVFLYFCSRKSD